MKFENINIQAERKTILIAPLDWGLGHATRCIPIIYELLLLNIQVVIAAEGSVKNLLKKEFPHVVFTELNGYQIRYSKSKAWFTFKILQQLPRLLSNIHKEKQALKRIVETHKIDAVISDNRLGLFYPSIPCIYMTHQLKIKTGNRFTEWFAQKIHYHFINKYSACWVPDHALENNLAGQLSHPEKLPVIPLQYIGPLSRFRKITVEKKYDLLVLLSGPEPQRTLLEKIMLEELKKYSGSALLVKGLPGDKENEILINKTVVINHLGSTALNEVIQQSGLVICRSGYTSVMDLVALQQKAIFIPTPGQTEQEYLAQFLMDKNIFPFIAQNNFSLEKALEITAVFPYQPMTLQQDNYKKAVKEFVSLLQVN